MTIFNLSSSNANANTVPLLPSEFSLPTFCLGGNSLFLTALTLSF